MFPPVLRMPVMVDPQVADLTGCTDDIRCFAYPLQQSGGGENPALACVDLDQRSLLATGLFGRNDQQVPFLLVMQPRHPYGLALGGNSNLSRRIASTCTRANACIVGSRGAVCRFLVVSSCAHNHRYQARTHKESHSHLVATTATARVRAKNHCKALDSRFRGNDTTNHYACLLRINTASHCYNASIL